MICDWQLMIYGLRAIKKSTALGLAFSAVQPAFGNRKS
jgi:hypothetical protein